MSFYSASAYVASVSVEKTHKKRGGDSNCTFNTTTDDGDENDNGCAFDME